MSLLYEKAVQEDLNVGVSAGVEVTNPGGGSLSGTQIGIHSFAQGQIAHADTWLPGSITTLSYATVDITVPGAAVGDFVLASLTTMVTNVLLISAHVSAVETVTVVLFNPTLATISVASGTLYVLVFKARG